jgi:hypothetical protein
MKRTFAGLVCVLLADCSTKVPVLTPEVEAQMHQELVNGQAVLDCNLGCVGAYGAARARLLRLYRVEDWTTLGTLVMQIGFQGDQSYFYLGRAAEGLGAYEAARKYYGMAGYIATAPTEPGKCLGVFNLCDGFNFPRDILSRLHSVQVALAQSQMAIARPVPNSSPSEVATSISQPPALPARPVRHATPKPAGSVTAEADWVRPPPVTR